MSIVTEKEKNIILMKTNILFALLLIVVFGFTSCSSEDDIQPKYEFKQYAFLWKDAYGMRVGDSLKLYPVISYQFAVLGDQPVDEIKLNMTIHLKDGRSKIITESDLTNFGQTGLYAPAYKYPKYWIGNCSDSKGIAPGYYDFTGEDVLSFEYEAKVRIGTHWFAIPKGSNTIDDPMDSIFI